MYSRNLRFEFSSEERAVEFLLPSQILCLRQTATTLEFLREKPNGSTSVIVIEGLGLGALRRLILSDLETVFRAQPYGEPWSRCYVTRIYGRLGWTLPKIPLAPDCNPVPDGFLLMETGLVRDVWAYERLAAFAVPRGREERFLIQFWDHHAYTLATRPRAFLPTLQALKASNLDLGTTHRFSAFCEDAGYPRCTAVVRQRYRFASVTYEERDRASQSGWNVVLDFRSPDHHLGPRMGIGV